jgi:catechol 2,3-dioxygenase-like lactoylglutathione lyase family enzyme
MIDHLTTYATDFAKTKAFYEAVLPELGFTKQMEVAATWNQSWPAQRMCAFGPPQRPIFWVAESKAPATPRHTAFKAANRAAVKAFYAAALKAGGKDNGPPGPRTEYHPTYFGAFVLDPDGNNIEAVCHKPE